MIRFWKPWPYFQGHYIIKTLKSEPCVQSTSWINGWNLTKLAQIHHWDGGKKWLDFDDLYLVFKVTPALWNSNFLRKKAYAEGYIVFVFPFIHSYVRSWFCYVCGITSKFYIKVSQNGYILAVTYQKAFIFGSWVSTILEGQPSFQKFRPLGGAGGQNLWHTFTVSIIHCIVSVWFIEVFSKYLRVV